MENENETEKEEVVEGRSEEEGTTEGKEGESAPVFVQGGLLNMAVARLSCGAGSPELTE